MNFCAALPLPFDQRSYAAVAGYKKQAQPQYCIHSAGKSKQYFFIRALSA
ncbi:MAG: hypothetical protein LBO67_08185 [Spirochaetaceae bacterium]|nr:hypothetical protein [Spirochaetaceae bacterium]